MRKEDNKKMRIPSHYGKRGEKHTVSELSFSQSLDYWYDFLNLFAIAISLR